jgi:hypothetical protein
MGSIASRQLSTQGNQMASEENSAFQDTIAMMVTCNVAQVALIKT